MQICLENVDYQPKKLQFKLAASKLRYKQQILLQQNTKKYIKMLKRLTPLFLLLRTSKKLQT